MTIKNAINEQQTNMNKPLLVEGNNIPYSSKSIIVFILSVINLFMFPIIPGVIALVMSKNALQEIQKSKNTLRGIELINIGRIISIVGLSLQVLGLIIGIFFATVGLIIAAASIIASV